MSFAYDVSMFGYWWFLTCIFCGVISFTLDANITCYMSDEKFWNALRSTLYLYANWIWYGCKHKLQDAIFGKTNLTRPLKKEYKTGDIKSCDVISRHNSAKVFAIASHKRHNALQSASYRVTYVSHTRHIRFTYASHTLHIRFTYASHTLHIRVTYASHTRLIRDTYDDQTSEIRWTNA